MSDVLSMQNVLGDAGALAVRRSASVITASAVTLCPDNVSVYLAGSVAPAIKVSFIISVCHCLSSGFFPRYLDFWDTVGIWRHCQVLSGRIVTYTLKQLEFACNVKVCSCKFWNNKAF